MFRVPPWRYLVNLLIGSVYAARAAGGVHAAAGQRGVDGGRCGPAAPPTPRRQPRPIRKRSKLPGAQNYRGAAHSEINSRSLPSCSHSWPLGLVLSSTFQPERHAQ